MAARERSYVRKDSGKWALQRVLLWAMSPRGDCLVGQEGIELAIQFSKFAFENVEEISPDRAENGLQRILREEGARFCLAPDVILSGHIHFWH